MADVVILVTGIAEASGQCEITGTSRFSGTAQDIGWAAYVEFDALAATINAAIKNAVIAEAANADPPITVGALDKKTLLGGAVGL